LLRDYCYNINNYYFSISNITFIRNFQEIAIKYCYPLAEGVFDVLKDLEIITKNGEDYIFFEDGGVRVEPHTGQVGQDLETYRIMV